MKIAAVSSKLAITSLTIAGAFALQQPMQAATYVVDDFSAFSAGQSIEADGSVHELLNIDAVYGDAITIFEGSGHSAYGAYNTETKRHTDRNGGVGETGGFADKSKKNAFSFTFNNGIAVTDFSLNMLDYGDWNPAQATQHSVSLEAYNIFGDIVSQDLIKHTTRRGKTVGLSGDAAQATDESRFGDTLLSVSGNGITEVKLTFLHDGTNAKYNGGSSDPNVGFNYLSFTTEDSKNADVPEPSFALSLMAIGAVGVRRLKRKEQMA